MNEILAEPQLIQLLDLTNTISTFDVLNTKKTIEAIANKGGDYVGALKGNQQTFYEDVFDYFRDFILLYKYLLLLFLLITNVEMFNVLIFMSRK